MPKSKNEKGEALSASKKPRKKKADQLVKPKKLRKITPSFRQKAAVEKLVELGGKLKGRQGKVTLGRILKEVGYSPAIQKTPQKVTESKGWQYLMQKHFPDHEVAEAESNQLHASHRGHYVFPGTEKDSVIKEMIESVKGCRLLRISERVTKRKRKVKDAYFVSPDNIAIGKSLDRIYRMKKRYPKEKENDSPTDIKILVINYAEQKGGKNGEEKEAVSDNTEVA